MLLVETLLSTQISSECHMHKVFMNFLKVGGGGTCAVKLDEHAYILLTFSEKPTNKVN